MALTSPGIVKGANDILVKIAPELAMVKLFAYDCSDAVADYGAKIRVPVVTGGTAVGFSTTNTYETTTGSLSDIFVTLNQQPKATIAIDGKDVLELANAPIWNKFAEAGANAIGKSIQEQVGALFTTSLTKAGTKLGTEGTDEITKKKLAQLRNDCVGKVSDTVLVLDPVRFAETLALFDSSVYGSDEAVKQGIIHGLYGFKAVICMSGMGSGVQGALVPVDSVAIAVRPVAVGDESCYSEIGTVSDENGFSLSVMRHGSPALGKAFLNVTALVGASLAKSTEVRYIAAS